MTTLEDCRQAALAATASLPEGEPLDSLAVAMVELGVATSVTSLDADAIDKAIARAFEAGASVAQVQEIIALVSGLGVHSLMVSSARVLDHAARNGLVDSTSPLDVERQALWRKHVGDDPFWIGFENEVPGFLDALLRLSPDIFQAFFAYCAVPWKSGTVSPLVKELVGVASDATPTHRFLPGLRLHLHNAIRLGAGRQAIMQTLAIAAAGPMHGGVP